MMASGWVCNSRCQSFWELLWSWFRIY